MRQIVIDVMGGEHGPETLIRGAAKASLSLPHSELVLVGHAETIGRILPECRHDGSKVRVHHASQVIDMRSDAIEAMSAHADSSIAVAADLVARGDGEALVSAGHPGATTLACARRWKTIAGIDRPALSSVYPTELRRGEKDDPFSLILDVGASSEASAKDLIDFAFMGAAYARLVSQNPRPRVALLSSGSDAGRGPASVVEAHDTLKSQTGINFIGKIEALDIPRGVADVIVCSGFAGNVTTRMLEGVTDTIASLARYAYKDKLLWRAALSAISSGLSRLKDVTDWAEYGGAPLLGYPYAVIQAHGHSGEDAIANAVRLADKSVRSRLCDTLAQEMQMRPARAEAS